MYDSMQDNQLWDLEVGNEVILVPITNAYNARTTPVVPIDGVVLKIGRKYLTIGLPGQDNLPFESRALYRVLGADGTPARDRSSRCEHRYTAYTEQTLAMYQERYALIGRLAEALQVNRHQLALRYTPTANIRAAVAALTKEN